MLIIYNLTTFFNLPKMKDEYSKDYNKLCFKDIKLDDNKTI